MYKILQTQKLKTMVRISNYLERKSEDGKTFFVLELQGGLEMVMSQNTGNYYATAKKTSMTSTFDEETCKALIGSKLPGSITRVESEPYEYVVKETGEVILLSHSYVYNPKEKVVASTSKEDTAIQDLLGSEHAFSENGVLENEMSI
jgi:hypothetical protein